MTATSTLGGVVQSKSGSYSLNLREKGASEALKNNGIFVANLSNDLRGLGKDVIGALAATSLLTAIDATKHDSSRAAANWDLAVSGRFPVRTSLSPLRYLEHGASFGKIGTKHSAGQAARIVRFYKQTYYGLQPVVGARNLWQVNRSGVLFNALGLGKQGTPRVELFNPIGGDLNVRRAGDKEHRNAAAMWHSYAYYAFGGDNANTFLPGLEKAREEIGNAYIPMRILAINQALKGYQKRVGIPRL